MASKESKSRRPRAEVIREPVTRPTLLWTPGTAKSALADATAGRLQAAADLCEAIRADDRVKQALKKRADAFLGEELTFEPGNGRRKGQAVRAMEGQEDWWATWPEHVCADLFSWGLMLGVGLAQVTWEQSAEHGGRDVGTVKVWSPRHLRWDFNEEVWKLRVRDKAEIVITPGDGEWVLYLPYGSSRPWTLGLWWPLSPWYFLKQFSVADWNGHNKAVGSPQFLGRAPADVPEDAVNDFRDELLDLFNRSAIVLPEGWDLGLLEAKRDNSEAFERAVKYANRSFDIAILGNNLTTEVDGGSLAAATIHAEVNAKQATADARSFGGCLHDQHLTFWADINFGTPKAAPWPKWATESEEDLAVTATTLGTLGTAITTLNAAIATQNLEVDTEQLLDRFSVPTRSKTTTPHADQAQAQAAGTAAGSKIDEQSPPATEPG